ncbi:MAG: tRNA lysidine(34) synthetase TilS [Deltaproteobacteria bacterium]|jgi:tRNA(Ile)-lysidine synthetase-like protein|nr:tRNA lysidine(34) synthetase TilS [Deltaproteobacteria bacterium]
MTDSKDTGLVGLFGRFKEEMSSLVPGFAGSSYVLGFSGGPDSLALCFLMAKLVPKGRVLAFHVDHGLRPGSQEEALRAKGLAAALGVGFDTLAIDVRSLAAERGKGLEEAGRAARYGALESARLAFGADYVVTAHHADDLTETILLKLVKGAGPGGLVGIPPKSGRLLRPLLGFSKSELLELAKAPGLSWVEDPSNGDLSLPRNLLRHEVLPLLRKLNPHLNQAFARASLIARAEEGLWEDRLSLLFPRLLTPEGGGSFLLDLKAFGELSLAERRRLMGRALRLVPGIGKGGGEPLGLASVQMALDFIASGGRGGVDLPAGRRIERKGERALLRTASRAGA